jgi:hypothetical protein
MAKMTKIAEIDVKGDVNPGVHHPEASSRAG